MAESITLPEPIQTGETPEKAEAFDKDAFLKECRDQLSDAIEADRQNREEALDDLRNLIGEQWAETIKTAREAEGRPCLVINKLSQFVRQVTGDIRQLNPAINVSGADGNASREVADIFEGVIRQIQSKSDASSVYESAAESAASCGMGYFRVLTDYEDEDSFNQEIKIERIYNPFSVYFDDTARCPTRSDAKWVYITDKMEEDDFREAYPKAALISVADDALNHASDWRDGSKVIVAEKFWIEHKPATLYMLADGTTTSEKPLVPVNVLQKRETFVPVVKWAKISGKDVLEGPTEFASKLLPVVAVMGEEIHIGDRCYRSSVIRHAKEPQRLYNYLSSAEAEIVALQPKSPFLVTPKQIAGHETLWAAANNANRPYLTYNPDPHAMGAPQRIQPPVSSQGLQLGIAKASDDMKATTGIYDASLGQRSQETSGVAIRQRQMESDVSTSIYSDNMGKAVEQCGRILLDMIPRIYDTARTMRILGKDQKEEMRQVNQPVMIQGQQLIMNNLSAGKYDLRVSVGPNYTTKRQEAVEKMTELLRAYPQLAQVAGDIVVRQMDFPEADALAERLEKTLPPELRPQSDKPDPQQQQAQAQQMQAQQAQMQMAMQMEQMKLRQEAAKADESEAQAAKAKADAMKAEADARKAGLELEMATRAAQFGLPMQGMPA